MKLTSGKFYKVTYTDKFGTQSFIGQYIGLETEYAESIMCNLCEKEGHKRVHQFNIPYKENSSLKDMQEQLDRFEYETAYFGTTCIKKCKIGELN